MFWTKVILIFALFMVVEPVVLAKEKTGKSKKKGKKSKKHKRKKGHKGHASKEPKRDPFASVKSNTMPDLFPPHD